MKSKCEICRYKILTGLGEHEIYACSKKHWEDKWESYNLQNLESPIIYDPEKDPWLKCEDFEVRIQEKHERCEHNISCLYECEDCVNDIMILLKAGGISVKDLHGN